VPHGNPAKDGVMAVQMSSLVMSALDELRVHPVDKWIRATSGGETVVSSTRALIVWEPRRVVPMYAVPVTDVSARLEPAGGIRDVERPVQLGAAGPPVLDPRTPFSVHSCPGRAMTIRTATGELDGAAFAPDDPALEGYLVLDWAAFDQWREEDEVVIGHPHDPFDRIDALRSSRHVVVSADGVVLAESTRPTLLFETPLTTRYYLPREDVSWDLLVPSESHTVCAYKGVASYWTARLPGRDLPDIAWTYEEPLSDARDVAGLVAFLTERLDLVIDGTPVERPVTPWSGS
jgi:uncharacterized protein (DUF427 family)